MKISNARRQADALIKRFRIRMPAVDVRHVARLLGLRIAEMNLGPDHSGLLISQPGLTPCIVVHEMHHEHRKRFTIGHEIGHHVLRHHLGDTFVHADSVNSVSYRGARASEGTDLKEIAANQFSSTLLMPTLLISSAVEKMRAHMDRDPEAVVAELARTFEVSEQAMTLRLKSLGYV